jgi:large subunit ribosomal protein L30
MAKVKITQVRSIIKRPKDQKATMAALGLRKMNQTVEKDLSPQVQGMIDKVAHLLKIEQA